MLRYFSVWFLMFALIAPAAAQDTISISELCAQTKAVVHESWQKGVYETSPDVAKIMLAAFEGDTVSVRRGLAALPAPDRTRWRQTALATAVEGGQPATVSALIEDGADPNARSWQPPYKSDAFHQLIGSMKHDPRFGGAEAVESMHKIGLVANHGTDVPPVLFRAVECSQIETATVLFQHGASVHVRAQAHHKGQSPLVTAVMNGETAIIQLLLAHGASSCHDDHLIAERARESGRKPVPTLAGVARKRGLPDELIVRLHCPAP